MANKKRQMMRDRLWRQDPHCRFCGRETRLGGAERHKPEPSDMACLLHLFTKLMTGREDGDPNGPRRSELVCKRCADDYGNGVQAQMAKHELWRRSGAYPMEYP